MSDNNSRIILALDGMDEAEAASMVLATKDLVFAYKIHDLWDARGPAVVNHLKGFGAARIFVDLKLHDIPKTVGKRARAIGESGADMLTIHASGGPEMARAAVDGAAGYGTKVLAVTVLTSLGFEHVHKVYGANDTTEKVVDLALWVGACGIGGIVCSALEVRALASLRSRAAGHKCLPQDVRLIVPGTRSAGADKGDQKRISTPATAVRCGADHLVIGSEVTQADDPVAALERLIADISIQ